MLNNEELKSKMEQSPAPRVTDDYIKSRIGKIDFFKVGETVTICQITLDNGYSVRGESACVNPENFDEAIGQRISYDNAYDKLWPLLGFALADAQYLNRLYEAQKGQSDAAEAPVSGTVENSDPSPDTAEQATAADVTPSSPGEQASEPTSTPEPDVAGRAEAA